MKTKHLFAIRFCYWANLLNATLDRLTDRLWPVPFLRAEPPQTPGEFFKSASPAATYQATLRTPPISARDPFPNS